MRRTTAAYVRPAGRPLTFAETAAPRPATAAFTACIVAIILAAASLAGCGGDTGVESETDAVDTVYIEYMAALTLATEDGLSGDAARERIAELGATPMSRDELDEHAQRLSRDPVRWSRLEEQIEERVEVLRREERSPISAP